MKKILVVTVAASVLASAGAAVAGPHDHDRGRDRHAYDHRYKGPPPGHVKHRWKRGERLPAVYRTRVVDYRQYRLRPPPRGYQYVRADNDIVLAAIATGLIASIIASN